MRKLFLTLLVACTTLVASAQFTVVTTITQPKDSAEWGVDNFTDNIGLGYQVNDELTLGVVKNGDDYDVFGRYNLHHGIYVEAQAPTEEMMDNMTIGVGYSFNLWKCLYVEPRYVTGLNEGEDGEFEVGLAYRF
jgi:opacity protein-like surface antigen